MGSSPFPKIWGLPKDNLRLPLLSTALHRLAFSSYIFASASWSS